MVTYVDKWARVKMKYCKKKKRERESGKVPLCMRALGIDQYTEDLGKEWCDIV